jgi:hypothetical protein
VVRRAKIFFGQIWIPVALSSGKTARNTELEEPLNIETPFRITRYGGGAFPGTLSSSGLENFKKNEFFGQVEVDSIRDLNYSPPQFDFVSGFAAVEPSRTTKWPGMEAGRFEPIGVPFLPTLLSRSWLARSPGESLN